MPTALNVPLKQWNEHKTFLDLQECFHPNVLEGSQFQWEAWSVLGFCPNLGSRDWDEVQLWDSFEDHRLKMQGQNPLGVFYYIYH